MNKDFKINKALLPLSWIYGLGVGIRNKLFDWKILPVEEFSVPVISIGNVSVGGTGKTPHTEYLIKLLKKKYKIAVLSRGYKRKTKDFILADSKSTAKSIGDEPYQMYRKFPDITVAVDSNRRRGIRKLLDQASEKRPQIIFLDDAYQHRYVKPSLSILLTDYNRLFYDDILLPAGRLREPWENNYRANIIICTKCPQDLKPIDYRVISKNMNLYPYQELFFSCFQYKSLLPVFPNSSSIKKESIERLKKEGYSFLLVTGLANPEELTNYVKEFTKDLHTLTYSDHHNFDQKDIRAIENTFISIKNNKKIIITSEKDAVRLLNDKNISPKIKSHFFYIPIEVIFQLNQENIFIDKIEAHVKNFRRNSIMAKASNS